MKSSNVLNVQVCGSKFYVLVEREGRWGYVQSSNIGLKGSVVRQDS